MFPNAIRICALLIVALAPFAFASDVPNAAAFKSEIQPLFAKYCFDCHGDKKQKGDVKLSQFGDAAAILKDRKTWRLALEKIEAREMPPPKAPQPSGAEFDKLAAWLAPVLNSFDFSGPQDPGRVTIHRLNQAEYKNTIRDLLAVDFDAASALPADGSGDGFDNIADTLFIPPLLFEKYYDAADQIIDAALAFRPAPIDHRYTLNELMPPRSGTSYVIADAQEIGVTVNFPTYAWYGLRVSAWADQAGFGATRLSILLDGVPRDAPDVHATEKKPQVYEWKMGILQGPHRFSVSIFNPLTDDTSEDPSTQIRKLHIQWLEITGPFQVPGPPISDNSKFLLIAAPGDTPASHREAAAKILESFMTRAFRRPLLKEELERVLVLFERAEKRGDTFKEALRPALKAVLISPHFLFRIEQEREGTAPYRLSAFEFASRLSYFIWSSMPDAELFELAKTEKLFDPTVLNQQVERMIKDPKARALADNFACKWLQVRRILNSTPDATRFPKFTPALKTAMYEETALFFLTLLRENRSLLQLLDADFTFVNEELAGHYGMTGVKGSAMQRVSLKDGNRGGVLTMASMLTITSYPLRTSPVLRGKWVLQELMGVRIPPPPPNAGSLPADDKQADGLSLRKRLEAHRAREDCASCHNKMDPIGFGLENYDAIGRWRAEQDGKPMDTAGVLPGNRAFNGPRELKKVLLAQKDGIARNIAEKMLTFALGRGLEEYDECTLKNLTTALARDNYQALTLVKEIAKSYPFQYRRGSRDGQEKSK